MYVCVRPFWNLANLPCPIRIEMQMSLSLRASTLPIRNLDTVSGFFSPPPRPSFHSFDSFFFLHSFNLITFTSPVCPNGQDIIQSFLRAGLFEEKKRKKKAKINFHNLSKYCLKTLNNLLLPLGILYLTHNAVQDDLFFLYAAVKNGVSCRSFFFHSVEQAKKLTWTNQTTKQTNDK